MAASRYEFCDVCDRPARYHLANSSSAVCPIARSIRLISTSWLARNFWEESNRTSIRSGIRVGRAESTSRTEQCGDSRYDNDRFFKGDYTSVRIERERNVKNMKEKR